MKPTGTALIALAILGLCAVAVLGIACNRDATTTTHGTATTAATTHGTTAGTATTAASAITTAPKPESATLFPFQDKGGLWGFMNARGETVIDPRFEMVQLSVWKSGDRLPVRLEGHVSSAT